MEPRDTSMLPNEAAQTQTMKQEVEATTPEILPQAEAEIATVEPEVEKAPTTDTTISTKESILAELKALAQKDASDISAEEVAHLKQKFYAIRNEEQRHEREAFVAAGNAEEAYEPATDEVETEFKEVLTTIKEKKAEQRAAIEAEQQQNYERKKAIVDKLLEMSADADNVNRVFPQVREMQNEFKEIGEVPAPVAAELWKNYQDAVEKFYDQLKINKELRDYDFKKNLAEKEALIAEAEKLSGEEDVITAFHKLQSLHEQWRQIGPVPKEVREEIWGKFKDISAEINKKYQAFFEERKAQERQNEEAKIALCERIEALDFNSLNTYAAWDEMTKQIIAAQEEWKKVGYASRKSNNTLFARFRETCDKFFAAKAEFFRHMKDVLAQNLERKIALCERAEALKDSTEWRKTADELAALQKEWKTIGAVAKKHSDQVWKRFLAACDYFFDQKKKNSSGTRRTERANLEQKREIIDKLKAIDIKTEDRAEAIKKVKDLQAEWQSVGHVPFGEKDAVYTSYREICNHLYEKLDMSQRGSRMASFENTINEIGNDQNKLYRERERLMRIYEQRKGELQTYENNLGFLSAKSKNGDSMLRDMNRRMQRIKDDLQDLEKKIKVIDEKL